MSAHLWDGLREGCGTCEFWWTFDNSKEMGSCKRHPPVMLYLPPHPSTNSTVGNVEQYVPTTAAPDWCGEYKRKSTDVPAPAR